MAGGRPTDYTVELGQRICKLIATHPFGLSKLNKENDWMPAVSTIFLWRMEHQEFSEGYDKAKAQQMDAMADEIVNIADASEYDRDDSGKINNECVNRARLRMDARKWVMERLAPGKYGDKALEDKVDATSKIVDTMSATLRKHVEELNALKKKDF